MYVDGCLMACDLFVSSECTHINAARDGSTVFTQQCCGKGVYARVRDHWLWHPNNWSFDRWKMNTFCLQTNRVIIQQNLWALDLLKNLIECFQKKKKIEVPSPPTKLPEFYITKPNCYESMLFNTLPKYAWNMQWETNEKVMKEWSKTTVMNHTNAQWTALTILSKYGHNCKVNDDFRYTELHTN